MSTTTAPAALIAGALRDAATCYRAGDETTAAEHVKRADWAMARHGITAELRGQTQALGSFAHLGLMDRAAEVADTIAATTGQVYA